jgi:putative NIF3 family GTP cyclohydrolase 1 type 2
MLMLKNLHPLNTDPDRRKFIFNLARAAIVAPLFFSGYAAHAIRVFNADGQITVGEIMDKFIGQIPGAPFSDTVDTLKAGDRSIKVTGIVTTMFATIEVIRKTIALGANFIIAHEPTFYNHADATDWLAKDEVYAYKASLLKTHHIAVWRNHDYIHSMTPDGVGQGLLTRLSWEKFYNHDILKLPPTSLGELISYLKQRLGIDKVRYIGNLAQSCQKVLFIPGAAGGKMQITLTMKEKPDVLIVGEIQEWETAEYIRDARAKGDKISLIVLGHIASEESGSEFMAGWLRKTFPAVKSTHVPSTNSLSFF